MHVDWDKTKEKATESQANKLMGKWLGYIYEVWKL